MSESCLKAFCPACNVSFGIAPLPMEVSSLSALMLKAVCPRCGAGVKSLKIDASDSPPDIPLPPSDGAAG
jgi:ribosomal protein S27AE